MPPTFNELKTAVTPMLNGPVAATTTFNESPAMLEPHNDDKSPARKNIQRRRTMKEGICKFLLLFYSRT